MAKINQQVSVIVTVKNEIETIERLLLGLEHQSQLPDEVIIVDAYSTDGTFEFLNTWKPAFSVKVIQKKGNRSVGRNTAIGLAQHNIIAMTDAGCAPGEHWLERLVAPLFKQEAEIVAGYYAVRSGASVFQQAAAHYFLVMPSKVNKQDFLPASRNMAITKEAFNKVGTFPEHLDLSEDYRFALHARELGIKMTFVQNAVVFWDPPKNIAEFAQAIYNFAYHDVVAGNVRPKAYSVLARYGVFILLLYIAPLICPLLALAYVAWSMAKHYVDAHNTKTYLWFPVLQFVSDAAVMTGVIVGWAKRIVSMK